MGPVEDRNIDARGPFTNTYFDTFRVLGFRIWKLWKLLQPSDICYFERETLHAMKHLPDYYLSDYKPDAYFH